MTNYSVRFDIYQFYCSSSITHFITINTKQRPLQKTQAPLFNIHAFCSPGILLNFFHDDNHEDNGGGGGGGGARRVVRTARCVATDNKMDNMIVCPPQYVKHGLL